MERRLISIISSSDKTPEELKAAALQEIRRYMQANHTTGISDEWSPTVADDTPPGGDHKHHDT